MQEKDIKAEGVDNVSVNVNGIDVYIRKSNEEIVLLVDHKDAKAGVPICKDCKSHFKLADKMMKCPNCGRIVDVHIK